MGVASSHIASEEQEQSGSSTINRSPILTNHQFSKMDWVVARKTAEYGSKLTFHKRLGADVLPDEDLIQQMSQELAYPTHRYWNKQTIHSLYRICSDGYRTMDCRYLTIVVLSSYILNADDSSPSENMYDKEELKGFYDSMVESVTCQSVGVRHEK
jgi:hypothetical protein